MAYRDNYDYLITSLGSQIRGQRNNLYNSKNWR